MTDYSSFPKQRIADELMRASPLPVTVTGGGDGGGLTNTELRATPVPVSGTFYQGTQPVSIASMPTTAVTGTFWPVTQPVSGTVAVSGSVAVTGTFYQATQPVSIASMPSTPVTGSFWQTTQPVSGTFWQATQPISIAATVAVSGPLTDGQLRATAVPVSGTFFQATQPVSGTVTANAGSGTFAVSGTFWQATQPVSGTVTITPPTLTKATQGSTGLSTQDLKDAGRVSFAAATVIGGVTCVSTEALLTMVPVRDGTASGTATTIAVTSNKRLRIQAILVSARSTGAAVLSARFALRMNPSGSVTATSPILAIASCTQQAAALAEAGDTQTIMFPDGLEVSGTQQVGLTQVCSGTGGVVYASVVGYEY